MRLQNLSIKQVTIGLLCIIGLLSMGTSAVLGQRSFDAAIDSQRHTLVRVLKVAAEEVMLEVDRLAQEMGAVVAKEKGIRNAVKAADRQALPKLLDGFFEQHYVTGGVVDLAGLRTYDLDGNFIAQSRRGDPRIDNHLPPMMASELQSRSGADKMKMMVHHWGSDGDSYVSALVPTGGMRLAGYIEVILKPAHNLSKVAELIHAPIRLTNQRNEELYRSDNWQASVDAGHSFEVSYTLIGEDGNAGVNIFEREDNQVFITSARNNQWLGAGIMLAIIFSSVTLAIILLQRQVFNPMRQLADEMGHCANGDLSRTITPAGLRDTRVISQALQDLVAKLRQQVQQIDASARDVAASSQHIAAVSEQTRRHSDLQKQEMEQSAAAINEMTSASAEVAQSAQHAQSAAHQTQQVANEGAAVVTTSMEMVTQLADEVTRASASIESLAGDVDNISTILDVIRGIAEQTNLLALNAAIEAARAGDHGRGFAVVSDEVRNLAARTQDSTREIQAMIERLQTGTRQAVQVMNSSSEQAQASVSQIHRAGDALMAIKGSTDQISQANVQIASAAEEQSCVAEEINRSIDSVKDAAIELAAGCTQMTGAAHELSDASSRLQQMVNQFKT
ncbi:MAG TPA: methyl-accepting chemotaxis protein [Motiliproteus sp.]